MVSDVLWILDPSPLTRECWFIQLGWFSTQRLWYSSINLPVFIYGVQSQSHIKSRQIATEVEEFWAVLEFGGHQFLHGHFNRELSHSSINTQNLLEWCGGARRNIRLEVTKKKIQIILLASKGFTNFWIFTRHSRIECAIAPPFVTLDPLSECGYHSLTYA